MKKATNSVIYIIFICLLSFLNTEYLSAQIASYPYVEDFESGPGGWTVQGSNTSWELGVPDEDSTFSAASGENTWVTNLDGDYGANEDGWVQSPEFNLAGLSSPYMQFFLKRQSSNGDGVVVQASNDMGASWTTVGNLTSSNINWYNADNLTGLPGGQSFGWTDSESDWLVSAHSLIDFIGSTSIIFRIAFGSDGENEGEGFAFDKFQIIDNYCNAGEDRTITINANDGHTNIDLNSLLALSAREPNTFIFGSNWSFISGPMGPRGPRFVSYSDDEDEDVDFPNTGSGPPEEYQFLYTVFDGECEDSAIITIIIQIDDFSIDEETIYICPEESITNEDELFNAFSLTQIRDLDGFWADDNYNDIQFPIEEANFYNYEDSTANRLELTVEEIDCSDEDITFSFANAENTNDGTYDYYEVDIMIKTTEVGSSLKLGDGKLFFKYNVAAFGEYVSGYNNVEITYPISEGYIAGQPIDSDPNINIYSTSLPLDNLNGVLDPENPTNDDIFRFSYSFKQIYSTSAFATDNITNTPSKFCHLKIRYEDVNEDPALLFETEGIYDNKFTTATICGLLGDGSEITNCLPEPKSLIVSDTFDNSGNTLSNNDFNLIGEISIYPNPVNGIIYVKGNIDGLNTIEVYSISGSKIMDLKNNLGQVDVSQLQSGIYFLKLFSDDTSKTLKVIKN